MKEKYRKIARSDDNVLTIKVLINIYKCDFRADAAALLAPFVLLISYIQSTCHSCHGFVDLVRTMNNPIETTQLLILAFWLQNK